MTCSRPLKEGCTGLYPGSAAVDKGLDGEHTDLSLLVRKQQRLLAIGTLEWRQTDGGMGKSIVCILHPQKLHGPG